MFSGSIQLPELSNARALPASEVGWWTRLGNRGNHPLKDSPTTDLGTIKFHPKESQDFTGRERKGIARSKGLFKKQLNLLRPNRLMITARGTGRPEVRSSGNSSFEEVGAELVKASFTNLERETSLLRGDGVISEMRNRIADIGNTQAIDHLLTHCNKSVAKFHF